jgi:3-mercaptopyruvate sulfurtransferase SseA
MRLSLLFSALLVIGAISFAACNAASSKATKIAQTNSQQPNTPTTYADGAPRITIVELQEKMKKKEVFIVDVRNEASFDAGHLPGAKLIPAGDILQHLNELPKDKLIVTYCS